MKYTKKTWVLAANLYQQLKHPKISNLQNQNN